MMMKQTYFKILSPRPDTFGGSEKRSHPKTARPLTSKFATHVVLKANASEMRLPKNFEIVNTIINETARKYGMTLYDFSVNSNHLHLLIRVVRRHMWPAFIRELSGRIAQRIRTQATAGRYWRGRPFTRIVRGWNKAFATMKDYILLNNLEAEGRLNRYQTQELHDSRYDRPSG